VHAAHRAFVPLAALIAALIAALSAPKAHAAPLDALLTARPEREAAAWTLELAADHANRALDVFQGRESEVPAEPRRSGRYRGEHVTGAVRVSDGLWLSGGLWRREISDGLDTYRFASWQAAGLWRFAQADGSAPALALRLSAWGNRARSTETHTPVEVPGAVLNSVKITKPSDRQYQADLIGTWELDPALDVSAVLGAGSIRLDYEALSATTTRNGCNYDLAFNGNDIFGTLAEPCSASGGVIQQFFDSSGDYGVDVAKEIAWRGHFVQAGVNAAWRSGAWTLRGGYLYHWVRRDSVDDILAERGDPVHRHNHLLALDAAYRFHPHLAAFLRGQVSTNLFFNDMPVTYNSSTSGSFGNRFSLVTVGLRASF
jgi:hypothetical protein